MAKGVDAVALRIRDLAKEHEIPIVEDPPLARGSLGGRHSRGPNPRQ